jgi:hypothetical protein
MSPAGSEEGPSWLSEASVVAVSLTFPDISPSVWPSPGSVCPFLSGHTEGHSGLRATPDELMLYLISPTKTLFQNVDMIPPTIDTVPSKGTVRMVLTFSFFFFFCSTGA